MILNILLGDPHERQFKIRENIQILSEKPAFNNLKEGIYINAVKVKKLLYVFVHLVDYFLTSLFLLFGALSSLLNPHSKTYLIALALWPSITCS